MNRLTMITGAVVAVVVVICMTVLLAMDRDVTQLALIVAALGLGGLFGSQQGIRNQINGNVEKLTNLLEKSVDHIAKSAPASEASDVKVD